MPAKDLTFKQTEKAESKGKDKIIITCGKTGKNNFIMRKILMMRKNDCLIFSYLNLDADGSIFCPLLK